MQLFYLLIKSKGLQSSSGSLYKQCCFWSLPCKWHKTSKKMTSKYWLHRTSLISVKITLFLQREEFHYSWSHGWSTFHLWRNIYIFIYHICSTGEWQIPCVALDDLFEVSELWVKTATSTIFVDIYNPNCIIHINEAISSGNRTISHIVPTKLNKNNAKVKW